MIHAPRPRITTPLILIATVITLGLGISGCGAKLRPDAADVTRVRAERRILVAPSPPADFMIVQPGTERGVAIGGAAAFGVFGFFAASGVVSEIERARGAELMRAVPVDDPLPRLRQRVLAGLEADAGLRDVQWVEASEANDPFTLSRRSNGAAALALRPLRWGLAAHRHDADALVALAVMTAQLVKGTDVLWQATCAPPRDGLAAATLAELRTNGLRLREMMAAAIDFCADDLVARFMNRPLRSLPGMDLRVVTLNGKSLAEVEATVIGADASSGLVAGPAPFNAAFGQLSLRTDDVGALERVMRESMRAPAGSTLTLTGTLDDAPFTARVQKNRAGRVAVVFRGLRLRSQEEVDALLASFTGASVHRVQFQGHAADRPVKVSRAGTPK
jgi:hypothetical protein